MIYLASPYTHADLGIRHARYLATARAAARLSAEHGLFFYSPIVHGHAIEVISGRDMGYDYWLEHGMRMLRVCEAFSVLMLPGWKDSRGVRAEIEEAGRLGKTIAYWAPHPDDWNHPRGGRADPTAGPD